MRWILGFAEFCWEFVVGDDWMVALAVVIGLTATYTVAHSGHLPIWWLLPLLVILVLPASIMRLIRRSRHP